MDFPLETGRIVLIPARFCCCCFAVVLLNWLTTVPLSLCSLRGRCNAPIVSTQKSRRTQILGEYRVLEIEG